MKMLHGIMRAMDGTAYFAQDVCYECKMFKTLTTDLTILISKTSRFPYYSQGMMEMAGSDKHTNYCKNDTLKLLVSLNVMILIYLSSGTLLLYKNSKNVPV